MLKSQRFIPHQLTRELHYRLFPNLLSVNLSDDTYAKCNYCGDLVKYMSGTSAMWTHLNRCNKYPGNASNKRQRKAPPNVTEGEVASSPSYSKFDSAACRLQLAKTIECSNDKDKVR